MVENCGEYKSDENWRIEENDGTADVYPPFPEDWDVDYTSFKVID